VYVAKIRDGLCDGGAYYNCEMCNYDGGDCLECNSLVDDAVKIGKWVCDGRYYVSEECNYGGGDCYGCHNFVDDIRTIGDEIYDGGVYNTVSCTYDGGDCIKCNNNICDYNGQNSYVDNDNYIENFIYCDRYKSLKVPKIGDGYCDGGEHNLEEYNFDGDDRVTLNEIIRSFDSFDIFLMLEIENVTNPYLN